MAGPLLPVAVGLGEERRRAGHEEAHVRDRLPGQARMAKQARVEGRNPHQRGRARQEAHHLLGVEFRAEQHRGIGQEGHVRGHEQAVRVVDRQGVDQDVVGRELPGVAQREGVRDEVAVRQHRTLGAPGRARRVEDGGEVVRLDHGGREGVRLLVGEVRQRPGPASVQRLDRDVARESRDGIAPSGVADDELRLRVPDEILDLRRRVGGVERKVDRAGPQGAEIEDEVLHRLLDLHRDPFARRDAPRLERVRHATRPEDEVVVGPPDPVGRLDRDLRGIGDRVGDVLEQVRVHVTLACDRSAEIALFVDREQRLPTVGSDPTE